MSRAGPAVAHSIDPFTTEAYARAVLNILEDFGEEKRRLEETQRAVLNILDDLEVEKTRAQDANRLKSEFLANMSHELRTPLNAIMGFSTLMAHGKVGPVSPLQEEFLGDILRSSQHLLQLINDVLDLAKVEAGKMEFYPETIDLPQLVNEVRNILRTVSAARHIEIDSDLDPACADLAIDPAKLKQVFYNYLSNALKFSADNSRVLIRVRPEDETTFRLEHTRNHNCTDK